MKLRCLCCILAMYTVAFSQTAIVDTTAPIPVFDYYSEVYGYCSPILAGEPNSHRKPWFYKIDIKLTKQLKLGPVNMGVYLWALNALNFKNKVDVFRQTGDNESDGWLTTEEGREHAEGKSQDWMNWYLADLTQTGTFGWQAPRQVRMGVRFEI